MNQPNSSQLVIFSKKEIAVIILLFTLIALFSFTVGLRMGKSLALSGAEHSHGVAAETHATDPHNNATHGDPLTGAEHSDATVTAHHEATPATSHAPAHQDATSGHGTDHGAGHDAKKELSIDEEEALAAKKKEQQKQTAHAEDLADEQLHNEVKHSAVSAKKVSTELPKNQKTVSHSNYFALQFGSHRTVAEASEQVSLLKAKGLESYYKEVEVHGKGKWYRVFVGKHPTKVKAEEAASELRKNSSDLPTFIVQQISE